MAEKSTTVRLTAEDCYWLLEAFAHSTPNREDMEPGERAAMEKIEKASERTKR